MSDACLLIGDIGGTNARFALAHPSENTFSGVLTLRCADYETAELAIVEYLRQTGVLVPDVVCLAAAGPIVDQRVHFLNNSWQIDGRQLAQRFPGAAIRLLNDFEAVACSIAALKDADVVNIGPPLAHHQDNTHSTTAVLGPGTGLGVAGLLVRDGQRFPVTGEGGHVGFAPENPLQVKVLAYLSQRFERVSDERLLSGPGLENIYQALCATDGIQRDWPSASEIFIRANGKEDGLATATLRLFYQVLGQVAGNLALTLGASDGVYIAGGIVPRYPELLADSKFRSGFENKGRHRSLMERIPTRLITHPQPGLLGASDCARQLQNQLRK
jgi:glucokinase